MLKYSRQRPHLERLAVAALLPFLIHLAGLLSYALRLSRRTPRGNNGSKPSGQQQSGEDSTSEEIRPRADPSPLHPDDAEEQRKVELDPQTSSSPERNSKNKKFNQVWDVFVEDLNPAGADSTKILSSGDKTRKDDEAERSTGARKGIVEPPAPVNISGILDSGATTRKTTSSRPRYLLRLRENRQFISRDAEHVVLSGNNTVLERYSLHDPSTKTASCRYLHGEVWELPVLGAGPASTGEPADVLSGLRGSEGDNIKANVLHLTEQMSDAVTTVEEDSSPVGSVIKSILDTATNVGTVGGHWCPGDRGVTLLIRILQVEAEEPSAAASHSKEEHSDLPSKTSSKKTSTPAAPHLFERVFTVVPRRPSGQEQERSAKKNLLTTSSPRLGAYGSTGALKDVDDPQLAASARQDDDQLRRDFESALHNLPHQIEMSYEHRQGTFDAASADDVEAALELPHSFLQMAATWRASVSLLHKNARMKSEHAHAHAVASREGEKTLSQIGARVLKKTKLLKKVSKEADEQQATSTKFVEVLVVNDASRLQQFNGDRAAQAADATAVMNVAHAIYAHGHNNFPHDIRVVMVGIMTFADRDPYEDGLVGAYSNRTKDDGTVVLEISSNTLLRKFYEWAHAEQTAGNLKPSDNRVLLSGRDFDSVTVGLANVGSMCNVHDSGSINACHGPYRDSSPSELSATSPDPNWGTADGKYVVRCAQIVAHELGHNFNMNHDDGQGTDAAAPAGETSESSVAEHFKEHEAGHSHGSSHLQAVQAQEGSDDEEVIVYEPPKSVFETEGHEPELEAGRYSQEAEVDPGFRNAVVAVQGSSLQQDRAHSSSTHPAPPSSAPGGFLFSSDAVDKSATSPPEVPSPADPGTSTNGTTIFNTPPEEEADGGFLLGTSGEQQAATGPFCPQSGFIMEAIGGQVGELVQTTKMFNTDTVVTHKVFSECSKDYIAGYFADHYENNGQCLENVPEFVAGDPQCGNGIVEEGEDCDCGSSDCSFAGGGFEGAITSKDVCCNGATCKFLQDNFECSDRTHECCHQCFFRPKEDNHMCRAPRHAECDLPEFCDGTSGSCPRDLFAYSGKSCTQGFRAFTDLSVVEKANFTKPGKCLDGSCMSMEYTCGVTVNSLRDLAKTPTRATGGGAVVKAVDLESAHCHRFNDQCSVAVCHTIGATDLDCQSGFTMHGQQMSVPDGTPCWHRTSPFDHRDGMCYSGRCRWPGALQSVEASKCGNGGVEYGEECDCGETAQANSPCCDCATCKLQPTAVCSGPDACCDPATCQFRKSDFVCRTAVDAGCDLPETCTGESGICPADKGKPWGTPCKAADGTGSTCYAKKCQISKNAQCQHVSEQQLQRGKVTAVYPISDTQIELPEDAQATAEGAPESRDGWTRETLRRTGDDDMSSCVALKCCRETTTAGAAGQEPTVKKTCTAMPTTWLDYTVENKLSHRLYTNPVVTGTLLVNGQANHFSDEAQKKAVEAVRPHAEWYERQVRVSGVVETKSYEKKLGLQLCVRGEAIVPVTHAAQCPQRTFFEESIGECLPCDSSCAVACSGSTALDCEPGTIVVVVDEEQQEEQPAATAMEGEPLTTAEPPTSSQPITTEITVICREVLNATSGVRAEPDSRGMCPAGIEMVENVELVDKEIEVGGEAELALSPLGPNLGSHTVPPKEKVLNATVPGVLPYVPAPPIYVVKEEEDDKTVLDNLGDTLGDLGEALTGENLDKTIDAAAKGLSEAKDSLKENASALKDATKNAVTNIVNGECSRADIYLVIGVSLGLLIVGGCVLCYLWRCIRRCCCPADEKPRVATPAPRAAKAEPVKIKRHVVKVKRTPAVVQVKQTPADGKEASSSSSSSSSEDEISTTHIAGMPEQAHPRSTVSSRKRARGSTTFMDFGTDETDMSRSSDDNMAEVAETRKIQLQLVSKKV
ncbi:unnamed protein product [Amoebophrya sp. A120]|nr:unnamed protein product [Amoebophrya sp. A120]|eukprot:GSA120T00023185001.1